MVQGAGCKATRPLLPAETYTILSRSGRKTTPPGQEGPIQNQNLRYRTLPFDAVVRDMSLVVLSVRLFSWNCFQMYLLCSFLLCIRPHTVITRVSQSNVITADLAISVLSARHWHLSFAAPPAGAFSILKYNVSSPILHSNIHQVLRLPQKVTLDLHQILPLPRKVTWTSPNTAPTTKSNTWTSPSTAPATKSDTWPSPSTAPTTKSDTHSSSSWHMKPHLQCAEQPMSPSKLTKYCACHAKWPLNIWQKFAENRWNVISNAGTIREWSDHDPRMIREWSENDPTMKTQTATRLATEVTFRTHHEHFLL